MIRIIGIGKLKEKATLALYEEYVKQTWILNLKDYSIPWSSTRKFKLSKIKQGGKYRENAKLATLHEDEAGC